MFRGVVRWSCPTRVNVYCCSDGCEGLEKGEEEVGSGFRFV